MLVEEKEISKVASAEYQKKNLNGCEQAPHSLLLSH